MACINIALDDGYGNKIGTLVITKQKLLDGLTTGYVAREMFYDGEDCRKENEKLVKEWHKNGKKGEMPIQRNAKLIEGHKEQKTFAFTNISAVYAFLFQRLWWMVDEKNTAEESFSMSVSFRDVILDDNDVFCINDMGLEQFKTLLEHDLAMFDGVANYLDYTA